MSNVIIPGRLLNVVKFEKDGTYIPSDGTTMIIVEACGGGAGGSAGAITSANHSYIGGGGQAGAYAKSRYNVDEIDTGTGISVVIGAGAVSAKTTVSDTPNTSGGNTYFGDLIECDGGHGASGHLCTTYPYISGNSSILNHATGGNILNFGGSDGDDFFALSAEISSAGVDACNPLSGAVLNRVSIGEGNSATVQHNGYGAGGSGALSRGLNADGFPGGNGSQGVVIIYEYS